MQYAETQNQNQTVWKKPMMKGIRREDETHFSSYIDHLDLTHKCRNNVI